MNAPQIIMIVLFALGIGIHMAKHGEPRTGNFNAVAQMISVTITAGILYWGGFWS